MTAFTWDIENYYSGAWHSIKTDAIDSVIAQHGFNGISPTDRIATTGTMQLTLNNAVNNTGSKEGYYSPGHTNCRTGFDLGALFRIKISDGSTTQYQLRSKATRISPDAGIHGQHKTSISCSDYFNDLAEAPLQQIPMQLNTYINLAIQTVLGYMTIAPAHTSGIATPNGPDVFPRLLFGMSDNKNSIISALQKLCQTDKSYLFLVGDATDGETLKWQSRHNRLNPTIAATFSNTMQGVSIERSTKNIYNDVTTVAHPCKYDSVAVILANTDAREIPIYPGESVTVTLNFTDPLQLGRRVDMIPGSAPVGWPVADTDFKMGSVSGGAGNNLNAYLTVTPTWGSNSVKIVFGNTGTIRGYINLFHVRGCGVYDYTPVEKNNSDSVSKAIHNNHPYRYDMPYCDYDKQANDFGVAILGDAKNPINSISSVSFVANDPNRSLFATYAATLDVGSAISITETVSGVTGTYFVGSIKWELREGNIGIVTLSNLEPTSVIPAFLLCASGDDVHLATTSILALYSNGHASYTPTDPYGNPFHVLFY
jgi:hypothetical protein